MPTFTGHDGRVIALAVTGDGARVVIGSLDGTVRVWSLTPGRDDLA